MNLDIYSREKGDYLCVIRTSINTLLKIFKSVNGKFTADPIISTDSFQESGTHCYWEITKGNKRYGFNYDYLMKLQTDLDNYELSCLLSYDSFEDVLSMIVTLFNKQWNGSLKDAITRTTTAFESDSSPQSRLDELVSKVSSPAPAISIILGADSVMGPAYSNWFKGRTNVYSMYSVLQEFEIEYGPQAISDVLEIIMDRADWSKPVVILFWGDRIAFRQNIAEFGCLGEDARVYSIATRVSVQHEIDCCSYGEE
jgi:hypothetical protein